MPGENSLPKSLTEKAKSLPNAEHDKQLTGLERKVGSLTKQLQHATARIRQTEQELAEAEARIDFCDHFKDPPRLRSVARLPKTKSQGPASAIISLCDWHVEEQVDAKTVNNLNTYNLEIAEKRVRKTFERAVGLLENARQLSRIQEIVLALLGDHITGYIHEELLESNYLSPPEATLFAQEQICWGISYLLKNVDLPIRIVTANGNHGRTTPRKRISTSYKNSFEWLMFQQTSKFYLNEPRVHWQIAHAYHNYLDIQGKTVRFHHGDALRYQGGVGGITIPVLKAVAAWDRTRRADLDVFGHWHQPLFHRKFISCNCLIGFNAYAIEIKAEYSEPSQTLIVLDRNRPAWTRAEEIYCD